jgi:hypothetical protein
VLVESSRGIRDDSRGERERETATKPIVALNSELLSLVARRNKTPKGEDSLLAVACSSCNVVIVVRFDCYGSCCRERL